MKFWPAGPVSVMKHTRFGSWPVTKNVAAVAAKAIATIKYKEFLLMLASSP
jgi:hypothetical protein